jgi:hypothetical protein
VSDRAAGATGWRREDRDLGLRDPFGNAVGIVRLNG